MNEKMTFRIKMKKLIFTVLFAFILSVGSASAQIYIMEQKDFDARREEGEMPGFIGNPGAHGSGQDWYAPVGDGVLLLTCLSSVFLFCKNRKRK